MAKEEKEKKVKPPKEKAPKVKKEKASKKEKESITAGQLYQYDAFISYRHIQPDKAIAENLHKQLENFKLPKNVNASLANGHTKIERVFRDEDELPIASSLEDAIVNALQNSEWLIVICSPRILESAWCRLEISTFIRLHGRDHVLAVLVEGEPDEAIPEELLYEESTTYNALGVPETTRRRVEPLACDIRDKSTKKMIKNLESQKLRLLAKMFNLNYDDLRQRHREKAMRRRLKLASIAAAVFFVIFLISSIGFITVAYQNKKINEQNEELATQAELIANQNTSLLRSQAISTANEALYAYNDDDRQTALQLAYNSLTEVDGNEMPYTTAGERALTQALNVYAQQDSPCAFSRFAMPGQIVRSELSLDAQYYLALDEFGNLYVWDVVSLAKVCRLEGLVNEFSFTNTYSYVLVDNTKIYYLNDSGMHLFDFITYDDTLIKPGSYTGITINSARTRAALISTWSNRIDIIDVTSDTVVTSLAESDLTAPMPNNNIVTDENGDIITNDEAVDISQHSLLNAWCIQNSVVYAIGDNWEGEEVYLRVFDLDTMTTTKQYVIDANEVQKAMVVNGSLYFIAHQNPDIFNQHEIIGRFDLATDELVWTYEREGYSSVLKCALVSSGEIIITHSYDRLIVLDGLTGEVMADNYGVGDVVDLTIGEDYIYFISSDNVGFVMSLEGSLYGDAIGFPLVNSSIAEHLCSAQRVNIGTGIEVFLARERDNYIYVYREINNPQVTSGGTGSGSIGNVTYRDADNYEQILAGLNSTEHLDGSKSAVTCNSDNVTIVNMNNNSFSLYVDGEFLGNYDSSVVSSGGYSVAMNMDAYYGTDADGNYLIANSGLIGFRISPDGEVVSVIDGLHGYNSRDNTIDRYIDGVICNQPIFTIDELTEMAEIALGAY